MPRDTLWYSPCRRWSLYWPSLIGLPGPAGSGGQKHHFREFFPILSVLPTPISDRRQDRCPGGRRLGRFFKSDDSTSPMPRCGNWVRPPAKVCGRRGPTRLWSREPSRVSHATYFRSPCRVLCRSSLQQPALIVDDQKRACRIIIDDWTKSQLNRRADDCLHFPAGR